MTSLNIGRVTTERLKRRSKDCPRCKAPEKKRIDGGGFGPAKLTLCGECGYEFGEDDL